MSSRTTKTIVSQQGKRGPGGGRGGPKRGRGGARRGSRQSQGVIGNVRSTFNNFVIERAIPLFPYATMRRLRYADSASFVTGVSTANSYIFSANGLYDPNITGTGHQPAGFDQMMLSYEHYVVTRARMTCTFRNREGAYTLDVAIAITPSTTPATDYLQAVEDGMLVKQRLGFSPYDGSQQTMSLVCDVAKSLGVVKLRDYVEAKGTIAANPVEQTYFALMGWNPENATQITAGIEVVIDYEAWFLEPRLLAPSLKLAMSQALRKEATERKTAK